VNIRPATLSDAAAIAELLCNLEDYPKFKTQGVEALTVLVRENLERRHEQQLVLVAELDAQVMGYAVVYWTGLLFSSVEGYVSELFVHSAASGRGVGTTLLEKVKLEARARGCRRLTLINLKDRESYKRGFYACRGWAEQVSAARFVLNLEGNL
jgi:ribosomal protein S18 acetylase RimI-like enzyme